MKLQRSRLMPNLATVSWSGQRRNTVQRHCVHCWYASTDLCVRWPSVPHFLGQSWFLMMCPGINDSSPGTPICPVFCSVSRICPNLLISAVICLCISGQKSVAKNQLRYYLYIREIAGGWDSTPDPAGGAHNVPPDPQVGPPDGSRLWHSHLTIRTFGARPGLLCPNYGHLTSVSRAGIKLDC